MTLRKFLLIPLLISLALFAYFSDEVRHSFSLLLDTLHINVQLIAILVCAVALQLCGHMVRAYKTRLIFGVVKESSTRFQFRALSIGYLFNTILPFRLGELIRARVISGAMTISFGYAFTLIIFERLLDVLILGVFGCLALLGVSALRSGYIMSYALVLTGLGIAGLGFYVVLTRRNERLLRMWYRFTKLFNDRLRTQLRFKAWTIIYGLQRTLRGGVMFRYVVLSLVSWLLYIVSLLVVAGYVLHRVSFVGRLIAAIAPYYGVSLPAGPAGLGSFSNAASGWIGYLGLSHTIILVYDLVTWFVLVLPISAIGVVLLFVKTRESLWYDLPPNASQGSLANKLYRTEDISGEMEVFLENYFAGNSLSRIVHDMELHNDFKLVKYFKGGSDAITILALQDGKQVVKKIIPNEFESRLKAQYDWLRVNGRKEGIVKALEEHYAPAFYAIDLEYDAANEMFYDFIHRSTLTSSKRVLDDVWKILLANVYGRVGKLAQHTKERDAYIEKHIFGCLDKAAAVDAELIRAAEPEKIVINGVPYDNLYQIIEKIHTHQRAWKDISMYRKSQAVHGDVIVDNLLVSKSTGRPLIIDPAPDGNIIQGPVFDFGKNLQSLYCGYETLLLMRRQCT